MEGEEDVEEVEEKLLASLNALKSRSLTNGEDCADSISRELARLVLCAELPPTVFVSSIKKLEAQKCFYRTVFSQSITGDFPSFEKFGFFFVALEREGLWRLDDLPYVENSVMTYVGSLAEIFQRSQGVGGKNDHHVKRKTYTDVFDYLLASLVRHLEPNITKNAREYAQSTLMEVEKQFADDLEFFEGCAQSLNRSSASINSNTLGITLQKWFGCFLDKLGNGSNKNDGQIGFFSLYSAFLGGLGVETTFSLLKPMILAEFRQPKVLKELIVTSWEEACTGREPIVEFLNDLVRETLGRSGNMDLCVTCMEFVLGIAKKLFCSTHGTDGGSLYEAWMTEKVWGPVSSSALGSHSNSGSDSNSNWNSMEHVARIMLHVFENSLHEDCLDVVRTHEKVVQCMVNSIRSNDSQGMKDMIYYCLDRLQRQCRVLEAEEKSQKRSSNSPQASTSVSMESREEVNKYLMEFSGNAKSLDNHVKTFKNVFLQQWFQGKFLPALLTPEANACTAQLQLKYIEALANRSVVHLRSVQQFRKKCKDLGLSIGIEMDTLDASKESKEILLEVFPTSMAIFDRLPKAILELPLNGIELCIKRLEMVVRKELGEKVFHSPRGNRDLVACQIVERVIQLFSGMARILSHEKLRNKVGWEFGLLGMVMRNDRLASAFSERISELVLVHGMALNTFQIRGISMVLSTIACYTCKCETTQGARTLMPLFKMTQCQLDPIQQCTSMQRNLHSMEEKPRCMDMGLFLEVLFGLLPLGSLNEVAFAVKLACMLLSCPSASAAWCSLEDLSLEATNGEHDANNDEVNFTDEEWLQSVVHYVPKNAVHLLMWVERRFGMALDCSLDVDDANQEALAILKTCEAVLKCEVGEKLATHIPVPSPSDLALLEIRSLNLKIIQSYARDLTLHWPSTTAQQQSNPYIHTDRKKQKCMERNGVNKTVCASGVFEWTVSFVVTLLVYIQGTLFMKKNGENYGENDGSTVWVVGGQTGISTVRGNGHWFRIPSSLKSLWDCRLDEVLRLSTSAFECLTSHYIACQNLSSKTEVVLWPLCIARSLHLIQSALPNGHAVVIANPDLLSTCVSNTVHEVLQHIPESSTPSGTLAQASNCGVVGFENGGVDNGVLGKIVGCFARRIGLKLTCMGVLQVAHFDRYVHLIGRVGRADNEGCRVLVKEVLGMVSQCNESGCEV